MLTDLISSIVIFYIIIACAYVCVHARTRVCVYIYLLNLNLNLIFQSRTRIDETLWFIGIYVTIPDDDALAGKKFK